MREIAALPLADRVPNRGVPTGPRSFSWRPLDAATLVWAEALDGGNPNVQAAERDKLMMLKAPFNAAPVEIVRTQQRYAGLNWSEKADVALLSDYDVNRKWVRTWQINVDDAQNSRRLVWDMSSDEKYADPGRPVRRQLANGFPVIKLDGETIYLSGAGSSPDGDRPFLDRFDLKTQKAERLFRSDKASYEQFLGFAGNDTKRLMTWYQSATETPNAIVRTLGAAATSAAAGEPLYASTSSALTHLTDPTPEVRQIKKRLVKYKRADGIELSFTLYTPPGYKEGTRLPTILNAIRSITRTPPRQGRPPVRRPPSRACASTACCCCRAMPSSTAPPSRSSATRARPTTPTPSSWWRTPRRPSTKPCAWAWPTPTASA